MKTLGDGQGDQDLRRIPPVQEGMWGRAQAVLESARFQRAIAAVIVVNAITLGLETSTTIMAQAVGLLSAIDRLYL